MGAIAEIEGKLIKIGKEIDSKSGTFKHKEIEIYIENTRDSKYDDYHEIQVSVNNYQLLEKFKVGSMVKATVNLIGRPWTNPKTQQRIIFKTYSLWKMEFVGANNAPRQDTGLQQRAENVGFVSDDNMPDDERDLPF